jgi:hypothetical protein
MSFYLIAALVVSMTLTGFLSSTSTGSIKQGFTYFFTPVASATSEGDVRDGGDTDGNGEVTSDDGGSNDDNEQGVDNDEGGNLPDDRNDTPNQDESNNGDKAIDCPAGEHLDEDENICVPDTSQQEQIEGLTATLTSNQQTTCPDDSKPDNSGNCPTPATSPTQDSHILIMPNTDGTCPQGSHKYPGSQVCEKDTIPLTSEGGTATTPASNAPPLTPQQQYETCLRGIGGDIPGNCTPPSAANTEQNIAPQTLIQQTCKDGTTPDANGVCQDGSTPEQACQGDEVLDPKGGCVSPGTAASIKNGTLIPLGDGKFKLATAPPIPNTNSIAPICPVGFHLALSKCVVNSGGCPAGTIQDDDICSPLQAHYNIPSNVAKNQDGTCPDGYHSNSDTDLQCEINSEQKLPNGTCPDGTILTNDDLCVQPPVIPGSTTGSGGGFIQMLPTKPANTDGTGSTTPSQYVPAVNGECPPGSHEAGGSAGNAGQPGTGVVNCRLDDSAANPQTATSASTPPEQPPADTPNGAPVAQVDPLILLNKQTCPPLPIDANGRCPGIDMRGGGLGLPPVKPGIIKEKPLLPDGSCDGVFDPNTNKCYEDDYAPPCPRGYGRVGGFCPTDQNGAYLPLGVNPKIPIEGPCASNKGVHLASGHGVCFLEEDIARNPDGSCRSGYFPTGVNNEQCSLKIHDPLPDGSCPAGYHKVPTPTAPVPGGNMCKLDALKLTNDDLTYELPGGYCPVGYQKRSGFNEHQCFRIT